MNEDKDMVKYFPGPLKGYVVFCIFFISISYVNAERAIRFMSVARKMIREAIPHLKPIVDERKAMMAELGDDWTDKPVSRPVYVISIRVCGGH